MPPTQAATIAIIFTVLFIPSFLIVCYYCCCLSQPSRTITPPSSATDTQAPEPQWVPGAGTGEPNVREEEEEEEDDGESGESPDAGEDEEDGGESEAGNGEDERGLGHPNAVQPGQEVVPAAPPMPLAMDEDRWRGGWNILGPNVRREGGAGGPNARW